MDETYAAGIDKVQRRANMARVALVGFYLGSAGSALVSVGEQSGAIDLVNGEDALTLAAGLVFLFYVAIFIGCVVATSMWINAAHSNAQTYASAPPEISPNWAVGWFFVPVANLFKPFEAMHQLWVASRGTGDPKGAAPALLTRWWGCWITGNIASSVSARMFENQPTIAFSLELLSTALLVAAAKFLLDIIARITAAQRSGIMAANVFA